MIKAFVGNDTYDSYIKAKTEAEKLSKLKNSEVKTIEVDEINEVNNFLEQIEGIDMFNQGSVIFAKRLLNNKKISEYLTDNFKSLDNFDIVIWHDNKLDSKLRIAKALKNNASLFISDLPREREFNYWINDQFKIAGIRLSSNQLEYISEHLDNDKWIILNELEKIKLYLKSKKQTILSGGDLKMLLGFNIKGDMWGFLDAVGQRNKKKSLEEFEKLVFYEDVSQLILAMLLREFKLLSQVIYAKEMNLQTSILGINPYVLKKTLTKSRYFTFNEIKNFIKKLFDLDLAIKKGDIDEKLGLTLFLSTL